MKVAKKRMVLPMIEVTRGNLLKAGAEALVNTVNTVGVIGKGIALMFKEAFPESFKAYAAACKKNEVKVGHMFVTERRALIGPKWIINFPTGAASLLTVRLTMRFDTRRSAGPRRSRRGRGGSGAWR